MQPTAEPAAWDEAGLVSALRFCSSVTVFGDSAATANANATAIVAQAARLVTARSEGATCADSDFLDVGIRCDCQAFATMAPLPP